MISSRSASRILFCVLGGLAVLRVGAADATEIGLSFDAAGESNDVFVDPAAPFSLYVVLRSADVAISGFDLRVDGIDAAGFFVLWSEVLGPAPDFDPASVTDFVVDTGGCVQAGAVETLVSLELFSPLPIPSDTILRVVGASGDRPVVRDCSGEALPLTIEDSHCPPFVPDGAVAVNPSYLQNPIDDSAPNPCAPVRDAPVRFGAMKARF